MFCCVYASFEARVWFHFRTKDARFDDALDLYVQIVLKQGQIEVQSHPADQPPNEYRNTDVELINRREVEELNKSIIVKKIEYVVELKRKVCFLGIL